MTIQAASEVKFHAVEDVEAALRVQFGFLVFTV